MKLFTIFLSLIFSLSAAVANATDQQLSFEKNGIYLYVTMGKYTNPKDATFKHDYSTVLTAAGWKEYKSGEWPFQGHIGCVVEEHAAGKEVIGLCYTPHPGHAVEVRNHLRLVAGGETINDLPTMIDRLIGEHGVASQLLGIR
jgi:hypothetical protein